MLTPESYQFLREVYPAMILDEEIGWLQPVMDKVEYKALAMRLHRSVLGCMPMIRFNDVSPKVHSWLKNKWVWRIASYLRCNFFPESYRQACDTDTEDTIGLMRDIAGASAAAYPTEEKAFLLHNLLSYVMGYRPSHYFQTHPDLQIPLPVQKNGEVLIKPCRFEQEVNVFGGVMVKVFVPCDGQGSATYLFSGTSPWLLAEGAGISLIDDFNPLGTGEGLRFMARRRLQSLLEEHLRRLGEPSTCVGHSLGGVITTSLAVDFPDLIGQAIAFNPARPCHRLAKQWNGVSQRISEAWSQTLPKIVSFVSYQSETPDMVSYVGSHWIGKVYRVTQSHESDILDLHTLPIGSWCGRVDISPINTEEANQRVFRKHGWATLVYTLIAVPIAITFLAMVTLKRFLIGWHTGGVWRWGVLGIPFCSSGSTSAKKV